MAHTLDSLQKYVGSLFMHTKKAVKANSAIVCTPGDRIFVVVGVSPPEPAEYVICNKPNNPKFGKKVLMSAAIGPYLMAWKCTLLPNGNVEHPAYPGKQFKPDDARLFKVKVRGSTSTPTAFFRPDSFYKQLFAITRVA